MAKHVTLTQLDTALNGMAAKNDIRFRKNSDPIGSADLDTTLAQTIENKANAGTTLADYNINNAYTKDEIDDIVDSNISSVYKPGGSKTAAQLTSALLIADNEGRVYNMTEQITSTADFVEGAGKIYPIGSNIMVVEDSPAVTGRILTTDTVATAGTTYYTRSGSEGAYDYTKVTDVEVGVTDVTGYYVDGVISAPTYKFDALPGFIDLSNYASKDTATSVANGLMSASDKEKLDSFEEATDAEITLIVNGLYTSGGGTGSGD